MASIIAKLAVKISSTRLHVVTAARVKVGFMLSLLKISTIARKTVATVNFSVPDEIKEAFNKAFEGENKSAIIARLMREAVEEKERQKRRQAIIEQILQLRADGPAATDEEIRQAREEGRP